MRRWIQGSLCVFVRKNWGGKSRRLTQPLKSFVKKDIYKSLKTIQSASYLSPLSIIHGFYAHRSSLWSFPLLSRNRQFRRRRIIRAIFAFFWSLISGLSAFLCLDSIVSFLLSVWEKAKSKPYKRMKPVNCRGKKENQLHYMIFSFNMKPFMHHNITKFRERKTLHRHRIRQRRHEKKTSWTKTEKTG